MNNEPINTKNTQEPTMTWKVFMKAMNFLNVVKFELTVTLYHRNHKASSHGKTIVLDHEQI